MNRLLEDSALQKDVWFVISTITFFIVAFAFKFKKFMPYGVLFCVGYSLLLYTGILFINIKKKRKTIEEEAPLIDN